MTVTRIPKSLLPNQKLKFTDVSKMQNIKTSADISIVAVGSSWSIGCWQLWNNLEYIQKTLEDKKVDDIMRISWDKDMLKSIKDEKKLFKFHFMDESGVTAEWMDSLDLFPGQCSLILFVNGNQIKFKTDVDDEKASPIPSLIGIQRLDDLMRLLHSAWKLASRSQTQDETIEFIISSSSCSV